MLTVEGLPVDGGAPSAPLDGLWLTVSEVARQKGVSKQAIAKRIERFASQGLITTRPGPRGAKLVNLAEYDKVVGEASDAIREINAKSSGPVAATADPVLAREQARRMSYQADITKLDLDERLGRLLPVADVEHAMVRCGEVMVRAIDQLPSRADVLAEAIARDGVSGARATLKQIAFDLRKTLAKALTLEASEQEVEQGEDGKEV